MQEKRTFSVALEPWAKPGELPRYFRLFAFGENQSTKGSVWLTHESAFRCMHNWREYGNDLSGDYEHAVTKSQGEGAPASCWFKLAIRQDGIYAVNVKWTKRAAQYLRNREYRYFSPYFTVEQDDKGRWIVVEIINVALTNVPATKRQRPLVATALWNRIVTQFKHSKGSIGMITPQFIEEMKNAFKEAGAPDEILDKLALVVVSKMSSCGESEAPAEEPMPEMMADPMPEEKKEEEMAQAKEEEMPQAYRAVLDNLQAQVKALSAQVTAFSAEDKKRKAEEKEALFSQYKKEGRFRFSNEKTARTLLDKHGVESFRLVYDSVTPLTHSEAPKSPNTLPNIGDIAKDKPAQGSPAPLFAADEVKSFLSRPENKGKSTAQALIELSRAA